MVDAQSRYGTGNNCVSLDEVQNLEIWQVLQAIFVAVLNFEMLMREAAGGVTQSRRRRYGQSRGNTHLECHYTWYVPEIWHKLTFVQLISKSTQLAMGQDYSVPSY
jgi:hypothetical protein